MDNHQFEAQMREGERFHSLRLPAGAWPVIRVDGHGFSGFTASHYEKPFDERFHTLMVQTAQALLEELQGIYAYTESDGISILLPASWDMFDRSVEKAVSLSAGIASAAFTQASGQVAHFDSRVWLGESVETVTDYFRWRQSDAARCALNGWCYWTLRKAGQSVAQATGALERQSSAYKLNLLAEHGIAFEQLPGWQRLGAGLWWETYEKEGFDPIKQQKVTALRRRVRVEKALPIGDEYAALIEGLMSLFSG
jgi:tRNA(His) guanylyltransferase